MSETIARLNLAGHTLTAGRQRSWWLRETLAAEQEIPCPGLERDVNADVVIVGAGFTGLWTAYFLTETRPNLGIVVLEQDICGGGPSGRNGGFASGWGDELDSLIALYGIVPAARACRAISRSMVNVRPLEFPPQPWRALGAAAVRRAIVANDTAEELGRKPNPFANAIARLPRRLGYLLGP